MKALASALSILGRRGGMGRTNPSLRFHQVLCLNSIFQATSRRITWITDVGGSPYTWGDVHGQHSQWCSHIPLPHTLQLSLGDHRHQYHYGYRYCARILLPIVNRKFVRKLRATRTRQSALLGLRKIESNPCHKPKKSQGPEH